MKLTGILLCAILLLSGCSVGDREIERAMEFRSKLLSASEISFCAEITADYGDQIKHFSMDCMGNSQGDVRFVITEPETISGITGEISDAEGKLTFDDKVLFFGLLTDEQLSPISAPWILMKALCSGYIRLAGNDGELFQITAEDSFEENALLVDIWFDEQELPVNADILYDGKRILSLQIEEFTIR